MNEYYQKNKWRWKNYNKKWYKNNKDKYKKYGKKFRNTNPDKVIEYRHRYWENHKEEIKIRSKISSYKKIGLTRKVYEEMKNNQNGLCAICGNPPSGKILVIDHDHSTGKLRKLLCYKCNNGLGAFSDNPQLLQKAISYLHDFTVTTSV